MVLKGEVFWGGEVKLMRQKWLGRITLLCLLLVSVVFGWTGWSRVQGAQGDPVPPRTILVQGEGEIEMEPDVALLYVGVETHQPNVQAAQKENNELMNNVLTELGKLGVPSEDIRTSRFDVVPVRQYERRPEYPEIIGYRVTNELVITVKDLSMVGPILDTAVKAGANTVQNLVYSVQAADEWKLQALQKAVSDAKRKAETIAQALGLEIKGIANVTEQAGFQAFETRQAIMETGWSETPVSPRNVKFTARVNINFEI